MKLSAGPSAEQLTIRNRCFHPTGQFIEFSKSDIEQSIAQQFEKIVHLYRDRPAVIATDRTWTYKELDHHSELIARALVDRLGTASEPVAVLLELGPEVIAAILGVLKAGKFFSLLDTNFPIERSKSVLDDAQTRAIITNRDTYSMGEAISPSTVQIVNIDDLPASPVPAASHHRVAANAIGYLLYTSGTTGRPKGVIQNQRNILHGVMRRVNGFHICPADRLTLLSNATHQAVMNILSATLSGAAICPFDARAASPGEFAAWIERTKITIYHSSASLLRQLTDNLRGQEKFSSIRLVRSASETPSIADVEQYRRYFPDSCLFSNGLGSTETGTSTLYFVDKCIEITTPTVPIGYPLEDIEILLLDENGTEIATGVGEIAIRSRYVAVGYWRQPELTNQHFQQDPLVADLRTYRTGDLGRVTASGALEHLGRKDFQIKIRGHRVETAEVEQKLREHEEISQAFVIGLNRPTDATRLVAYLIARSILRLATDALREFLRDKLPEPMIPSIFVYVDALPLNPAGKVDRHALPEPGRQRPYLDTPFVPPTSELERQIARLWEEVLELDQIGIHDSLFDLGGHSIAAAQILARVTHTFKVELPIRAVFEAPTVAQMTALIIASTKPTIDAERLEQLLTEIENTTEAEAAARVAAVTGDRFHG